MVAPDHIVKLEGEGHIDALYQAGIDVSVLFILHILKYLGEHHRDHFTTQVVPHFIPGTVLDHKADNRDQNAHDHHSNTQNG